jgi:hypothetical protein
MPALAPAVKPGDAMGVVDVLGFGPAMLVLAVPGPALTLVMTLALAVLAVVPDSVVVVL